MRKEEVWDYEEQVCDVGSEIRAYLQSVLGQPFDDRLLPQIRANLDEIFSKHKLTDLQYKIQINAEHEDEMEIRGVRRVDDCALVGLLYAGNLNDEDL